MIIRRRKIFYAFSGILILASIISLAIFGLPLGIDFKGGALMEITFINDNDEKILLSRDDMSSALSDFEIGTLSINNTSEDSYILRFNEVSEDIHMEMLVNLGNLEEGISVREERFSSIGPTIGSETARKSLQAMVLVLVMIVAYVTWAFRGVKHPISSWRWGLAALAALFHDILITVGVFAIFAHFTSAEVGVPFIAALLTILGYSVNDTIVVFDRIRENILRFGNKISFADIADKSIRETIVRSFNVSLTTIFVLLAVFFFGGATIQDFVLTLIVGISVGTYSSIAIASPLLVSWAKK